MLLEPTVSLSRQQLSLNGKRKGTFGRIFRLLAEILPKVFEHPAKSLRNRLCNYTESYKHLDILRGLKLPFRMENRRFAPPNPEILAPAARYFPFGKEVLVILNPKIFTPAACYFPL